MDKQVLIRLIKHLSDDPLGAVFVCTFKTKIGDVRWNGGLVQTRLGAEKNFSLPIPAAEWLSEYGYEAKG